MIKGKVIGSTIDDNGNIKVEAEYTLTDGSKVTGKTRYNCFSFSKEKVLVDIKEHCETLMKRVYSLKMNPALANQDLTDIKYDCLEVTVKINDVDTVIDDK